MRLNLSKSMKHIPFFWLFLLGLQPANAQKVFKPVERHWEAGFMFGMSSYSGDLAEKHIDISETGLSYGAFVRYFLNPKWAVKGHLYAGAISGDDANAKDPERRQRSLRFGTNLFEVAVVGEWHILGKNRFSKIGDYKSFVSPYVYAGVGGVFGGPKTEYYGPPDQRDIFLTGPFPETGLNQTILIIPVGIGLRYDLNERFILGLEISCRPLFTDKLDGVSLNGNPNRKDWYYFGGATIAFILGQPKNITSAY